MDAETELSQVREQNTKLREEVRTLRWIIAIARQDLDEKAPSRAEKFLDFQMSKMNAPP